jgi:hypothetical protein
MVVFADLCGTMNIFRLRLLLLFMRSTPARSSSLRFTVQAKF